MVSGVFPDWGSNLCLLHWQAILYHWGARKALIFLKLCLFSLHEFQLFSIFICELLYFLGVICVICLYRPYLLFTVGFHFFVLFPPLRMGALFRFALHIRILSNTNNRSHAQGGGPALELVMESCIPEENHCICVLSPSPVNSSLKPPADLPSGLFDFTQVPHSPLNQSW